MLNKISRLRKTNIIHVLLYTESTVKLICAYTHIYTERKNAIN